MKTLTTILLLAISLSASGQTKPTAKIEGLTQSFIINDKNDYKPSLYMTQSQTTKKWDTVVIDSARAIKDLLKVIEQKNDYLELKELLISLPSYFQFKSTADKKKFEATVIKIRNFYNRKK